MADERFSVVRPDTADGVISERLVYTDSVELSEARALVQAG
ncbi:hypothetical protein [Actinomadura sp. KC06]|nr:hypothetical protein [Actinomadura sp. KC06]